MLSHDLFSSFDWTCLPVGTLCSSGITLTSALAYTMPSSPSSSHSVEPTLEMAALTLPSKPILYLQLLLNERCSRNLVIISVIGVPGAILGGFMVDLPVIGRKGTLSLSTCAYF